MVEGLIQEKMTLQQLWQNKPKKKKKQSHQVEARTIKLFFQTNITW